MHAKIFLLTCLTILFGSIRAPAQQDAAEIPPPKPPFVAPVPANADWTVTLQYLAAPPAAGGKTDGRMTEVHSTKVGNIKRDRISYTGKPPEEHWFANTLSLQTDAKGEVSVQDLGSMPASDNGDPNPSVAVGYPGVKWLAANCYDKVVTLEKHQYYHFVREKLEAWIDVETHLPLAYRTDNMVFRFKFNAPPDAPLVMPPEYQKAYEFCQGAIDRRKKVATELSRRP